MDSSCLHATAAGYKRSPAPESRGASGTSGGSCPARPLCTRPLLRRLLVQMPACSCTHRCEANPFAWLRRQGCTVRAQALRVSFAMPEMYTRSCQARASALQQVPQRLCPCQQRLRESCTPVHQDATI